MNRTRKLFAVIVAFALLLSCLTAFETPADESGVFEYYLDGDAAVLTKVNASGDVVVPDTLGGKPVTTIDDAFRNNTKVTSVVLPDSLTVIKKNSFAYCTNLESITFNDGLSKIFEAAFSSCVKLSSVELPDSLTVLGQYAFAWCENLTYVKLSNSMRTIDKGTFSGCTLLGYVDIPSSVRYIKQDAFGQTAYTSNKENRENGMLYMGSYLLSVDTSVFGRCEIKPGTKTVADRAFVLCNNVTEVVLYDDIVNIGEEAFFGCVNLSDVYFSGDVAKRKKLEIGKSNSRLENATWHYYYQPGVKEYMPGDINGDDKVNNKDVLRLLKYHSDWDVDVKDTVLDVNGDGELNNKDVTRLFQYLSGWDVKIYSYNVGYDAGGGDSGPVISF